MDSAWLPLLQAPTARRTAAPDETRRRPSGRERASWRPSRSTMAGALLGIGALAGLLALPASGWPAVDDEVTQALRPAGDGFSSVPDLASTAALRLVWLPTAALLLWWARWRALLALVTALSLAAMPALAAGPPAADSWRMAVVAAVLTSAVAALSRTSRERRVGGGLAAAALLWLVVSRSAAGGSVVGHLLGTGLGWGAVVASFGVLAPVDDFPVTWSRGVRAHLRLDEGRRTRVLTAVREQLRLPVVDLEPYRMDGSVGSTPCRLTLAGAPGRYVFAKLYALSHLRSDRSYKLFRALRYGRLEDEAPFSSVRRLVEREDYLLRLLRDHGLRVPAPLGLVQVVPGREYALVTELLPQAHELLAGPVDAHVVDSALEQLQLLWLAGVAHRDIKPSNLLVSGGQVHLIDVSFGEVRPSRWREDADLANLLLVLAVGGGAPLVLERALQRFPAAELAECLATTGPATTPRQLRRLLREHDDDVLAQLRAGLPAWPRTAVQRWSARRIWLAVASALGLAGAAGVAASWWLAGL